MTVKDREGKYRGANRRLSAEPVIFPSWLFFVCFAISFTLPNLVFSGRHFFDTLHIMKWTVTLVPVGLLVLVGSISIALYGAERTGFIMDRFGAAWLILLLLITFQPLFIDLSSLSTFAKEWFYFASLFAIYLIGRSMKMLDALFKAILWGGCLNAAVNVVFAEMLIRGLNSGLSFILDVPGNYIGNTAQQEMFGLWMAMNVLNGLVLHLLITDGDSASSGWMRVSAMTANLILLGINSWGLWSSTARGGILSLLVAFVMMVICIWRSGRRSALRAVFALFGVVLLFVAAVISAGTFLQTGRDDSLIAKMNDMISNPGSIAGRASIWRTSWEVFLKQPISGVGLGQYKWHFLDAQRIMYEKYPELYGTPGYNWQFTYWAHSEYIQWLAETGIIGGVILGVLALWWLWTLVRHLFRGDDLSYPSIWGVAMSFLLWFDAVFSRPFHRIENSVWMALAFALANGSLIPERSVPERSIGRMGVRLAAAAAAASALYGFVFLAGGIYGDQLIYKAVSTPGTVLEKQDLLKTASAQLMAKDDADEQFAELLITAGKAQKDTQIISAGLDALYRSFLATPTSKVLFEMLQLAQEIGRQDLMVELARYLHPSMYTVRQSSSE